MLKDNERRGTPWLGGCWYEPGRDIERYQRFIEWNEETERMKEANPNLVIVGSSQDSAHCQAMMDKLRTLPT